MSKIGELLEKYSHVQNRKLKFFDMSGNEISIGEAIEKFITHLGNMTPDKSWYVGMTMYPEERKRAHERKKGIECDLQLLVYSFNEDDARLLEKRLEKLGFAIYNDDLEPVSLVESSSSGRKKHYVYIFRAVKNK